MLSTKSGPSAAPLANEPCDPFVRKGDANRLARDTRGNENGRRMPTAWTRYFFLGFSHVAALCPCRLPQLPHMRFFVAAFFAAFFAAMGWYLTFQIRQYGLSSACVKLERVQCSALLSKLLPRPRNPQWEKYNPWLSKDKSRSAWTNRRSRSSTLGARISTRNGPGRKCPRTK